eukprot:CAMPEP_0202445266 /NCGR_PEP_ID=MMETSP1360-20130828/4114_1 /ASSEMBLY_ACC=CAM_ASM_000848 /TAXON_ID=515479 /ORGANISM="Licmophora paradoxa, Strain CCMP2313" /LENGTH=32 /DNA_ID= /DNA_START= /DNA_END= /DNA_ORIENTATION=
MARAGDFAKAEATAGFGACTGWMAGSIAVIAA